MWTCFVWQQREVVGKKLDKLLKKQEKAVASDIVRVFCFDNCMSVISFKLYLPANRSKRPVLLLLL